VAFHLEVQGIVDHPAVLIIGPVNPRVCRRYSCMALGNFFAFMCDSGLGRRRLVDDQGRRGLEPIP
jgi:hypothetical protein